MALFGRKKDTSGHPPPPPTAAPGADPMAGLAGLLEPGEEIVGLVRANGFFASGHATYTKAPEVCLTDRRYIVLKGSHGQREIEASWPLVAFTSRVNSNEGSLLGTGRLNNLTLFTQSDETVTAGFKRSADRDAFKQLVGRAFGGEVS